MGITKSFRIPDPQQEALNWLSDKTDLSFSELMRRWIDYGLQETVLNEVIPSMSGNLQINK